MHPDFPYILLWSQNAGSTTVVKWFFAQIGLLEEALAHSPWIHNYENEIFKKRDGYAESVEGAIKARSHQVVKVVRNPETRAVSGFLKLGKQLAPPERRPQAHWMEKHWTIVADWLRRKGRDPHAGVTFVDHLDMLKDASERKLKLNRHLTQQSIKGEAAYIDEVVPIETFAEWAAKQDSLRAVTAAGLGRHQHHATSDPQLTREWREGAELRPLLPAQFKRGRMPDKSCFLNERTRPLIAASMRQDIDAYGHLYGMPQP